MANIVNQAQTRVTVDGQSAEQELSKLEVLAREYRDRMVEASKAGDKKAFDKSNKALQQVNREMRNIIRSSFDVNKVMNNLSTSGPNDLKKALTQLNKELNSGKVARGSKEWDELQRKIKAVRSELGKINAESQVTQSRWSKMTDGFNKYFGVVTAVLASVTGLSFAFRKMAEEVAKMDDVYSDVMKTTGFTRDQVVDLNEEFKKMDTRTTREQLNLLARDAGKLGKTSKKDILDFVVAANQIDVSLGEDLGEGAMKDIGKISDVFARSTKELDKLDLRGRMLAIGSAINELGASSTASESYMVDFAQRLGGVAAQAGISIQNILGYASALDQSGQAVEMSATAVQNFIMKLMGDPAKFAKIAGLEITKFNKLLKEDTNAAIKEVLTALSQKGGFQQLIPMFKDMGLDGARAVGVLSALATNIDKVNVAQEISNKAFAEGTSITQEYEIKNNNLKATLEKGRKAFYDASLELGERLSPALIKSTNGMTYLVKILPSVIDFFIKYGKAITSLVVTVGTYMVAVKLMTALTGKWTIIETLHYRALQAQNAIMILLRGTIYALQVAYYTLTGQVAKARGAMLAFAAVTGLTNPLVILTAVIAALAAGIFVLSVNSKEAASTAKLLNDVHKEAQKSIIGEKNELDLLLRVAKNEKVSKEERLKAIKRLNEISPEYLGNLSLENINTQEATKSVEAYTVALLKNARAKASQAKVDEIGASIVDNLDEIKKLESEISDIDPDRYANAIALRKNSIRDLKKENEDLEKQQLFYAGLYMETKDTQNEKNLQSLKTNAAYLENELKNEKAKLSILEEQQAAKLFPSIVQQKPNTPFSTDNAFTDSVELNNLNQKVDVQRKIVEEKAKELELSKEVAKVPPPLVDPPGKPEKVGVQNKRIKDAMRKLEIEHNDTISAIKKKFRDDEQMSEFEFNNQLLAAQDEYDKKRITQLNLLKKAVSDPAVKDDLLKQISEIDNTILDREIKLQADLKRIILNADPAKAEQEAYDTRLKELGLFGVSREKLTADQLAALELLEKQHKEKMSKIERPEIRLKLKALEEAQAVEESLLAENRAKGLISERLYKSQLLLLDIGYTAEKMSIDGISEEQRLQLQKESLDKQAKYYEENAEVRDRLNKKRTIESLEEARAMELAFLDESLADNLQNTELYEQMRLAIIEKYNLLEEEQDRAKRERMLQTTQFALESLQELMNSYSSYVRATNEAETASINKRYEAQIKAAGNNSKKVKKLEEQRDRELAQANRDSENRSFKIQIAMALAQTAQSAINAYSSTAAIPIVGPALAPIAAGVATAAGLINVGAIKKQHEAAMANYWVGGYTDPGRKYDVAGLVHKGEFVGNAEAVNNPYVRRVFDVVDQAQRTNTVSGLRSHDFASALEYKERVAQLPRQADEAAKVELQQQNEYLVNVLLDVAETNRQLKERLNEPFNTVNSVTGPSGIKQAMDTYNRLISNKSRGK
ncbi:phage tail tape measure protein [Dysgonomonas sp. HGC4]|uniref:phage tail tape measure protein n=1 Tax=Dysgonomonas sp. HGC4 TaxID=1658009 RepID=UPI0012F86DC9|nr:phage tail tape measure protein [Dysgonomonas sp. HGC4]MBD8349334.1 phage tail tape measure protein [Dysgonomonas sp. HGC4]